jgi:hypothetical protein
MSTLAITTGTAALLLAGVPAQAADLAWDCLAHGDGGLRMEVSGDFEVALDWGNEGTRCEGGPRPAGDALRLMFSRDDDGLLVVIGITGLGRGATGKGLLANVTIVRQGLGLFYGTLGADACIVDIAENSLQPGPAPAYRVAGRGRCEAAIGAIGRDASIRVAPFEFAGLAYWPAEAAED